MEVDGFLSASPYTLTPSGTLATVSYVALYPFWSLYDLFTLWDGCLKILQWLPLTKRVKATLFITGTRLPQAHLVLWYLSLDFLSLFPLSAALFSPLPYSSPLRTTASGCVFHATWTSFRFLSNLYIMKIFKKIICCMVWFSVLRWHIWWDIKLEISSLQSLNFIFPSLFIFSPLNFWQI